MVCQSMRHYGVRLAAPLRATHQAATSGIRSDFWQERRRTWFIYLKPPLIYCPMPPTLNAKERTIVWKTCSLCRVCISPKRRFPRVKSPLPSPLTCGRPAKWTVGVVEQMKEKQGVTEQLKAENQMLWMRKMNNLIACAEEIVVRKMMFV